MEKNKRRGLFGVGIPGYRMEKRMVLKMVICKATYRLPCPLGHKITNEWQGTWPGVGGCWGSVCMDHSEQMRPSTCGVSSAPTTQNQGRVESSRRCEKLWFKTKRNEGKRKLWNQNNGKQPTRLFQAILWVAREPETGYRWMWGEEFQPGTEGWSRT